MGNHKLEMESWILRNADPQPLLRMMAQHLGHGYHSSGCCWLPHRCLVRSPLFCYTFYKHEKGYLCSCLFWASIPWALQKQTFRYKRRNILWGVWSRVCLPFCLVFKRVYSDPVLIPECIFDWSFLLRLCRQMDKPVHVYLQNLPLWHCEEKDWIMGI